MLNKTIVIVALILIAKFNDVSSQMKSANNDSCLNKTASYLYVDVDELPSFKQDDLKIMQFIYKNLKWPNEFDGRGTVIVSFIVTKDGNICSIKIEKGLNPDCNKEVIRVLKLMHNWKPGKLNNQPVDVILYIPILFRLD
jgi:protein TonB